MKTPRRSLLLALPVLGLTLASCGGPDDGDVAVVRTTDGPDLTVSEAQFKRFFNATLSQSTQKPVSELTPLNPPDFKECVKEKQDALPDDSQRKDSQADDFKKQCETQYEETANNAITQLVNMNWINAETARRGINVRKSAVARERKTLIATNFQGEENFKTFLKESGLNNDDVNLTLVSTLGRNLITQDATEGTDEPPTEDELRAQFRIKHDDFVQPERRDLRVIKAKNEADAKAARAAIEAGKSWSETAKKYSTDALTKDQGGSVIGATQADQPVEFAGTVFKAKEGELLGPIKGALGYYVVKVQKITPKVTPKFEDVRPTLAQQIQQTRQQEAIQRLSDVYQRRWSGNTSCIDRFEDLIICGGAGDETTAVATKPQASPPLEPLRYAPPTKDAVQQQLDAAQQVQG